MLILILCLSLWSFTALRGFSYPEAANTSSLSRRKNIDTFKSSVPRVLLHIIDVLCEHQEALGVAFLLVQNGSRHKR